VCTANGEAGVATVELPSQEGRAGTSGQGAELVAFPGVNAPIPEGADPHAWGDSPVNVRNSHSP
jgi:hypothetical protein